MRASNSSTAFAEFYAKRDSTFPIAVPAEQSAFRASLPMLNSWTLAQNNCTICSSRCSFNKLVRNSVSERTIECHKGERNWVRSPYDPRFCQWRSSLTRANNVLCRGCSFYRFSVVISGCLLCFALAISNWIELVCDRLMDTTAIFVLLAPVHGATGLEIPLLWEVTAVQGCVPFDVVQVTVNAVTLRDSPFCSAKNHFKGRLILVIRFYNQYGDKGIRPTREAMRSGSSYGNR